MNCRHLSAPLPELIDTAGLELRVGVSLVFGSQWQWHWQFDQWQFVPMLLHCLPLFLLIAAFAHSHPRSVGLLCTISIYFSLDHFSRVCVWSVGPNFSFWLFNFQLARCLLSIVVVLCSWYCLFPLPDVVLFIPGCLATPIHLFCLCLLHQFYLISLQHFGQCDPVFVYLYKWCPTNCYVLFTFSRSWEPKGGGGWCPLVVVSPDCVLICRPLVWSSICVCVRCTCEGARVIGATLFLGSLTPGGPSLLW